ncbi:hypothetical protein RDWZM_007344 [Blomia tropicalis]|uniref:Autophagy-related protein 101 n=1 Tax=Blomia tropicalis TaxID=40697 RepID=A0A9Q0LZQ1_BLOTA|nr:hypothetical protein RDWZM_007344 [Blomia tropicalis]
MNARSTTFEFTCLGKHVNEIVCSLFHPIIFNRTHGKIGYGNGNHYLIGNLGFEEIYCDFIDFTYIRVSSPTLASDIDRDVKTFVEHLRTEAYLKSTSTSPSNVATSSHQLSKSPQFFPSPFDDQRGLSRSPIDNYRLLSTQTAATGTIMLEFFQKSNRSWGVFVEPLIWEVWSLKFNCIRDDLANDWEHLQRTPFDEQLFDKMLSIVHTVQNSSYLPSMPGQAEVDSVFDTRYEDCSPYNYRISFKIGSGPRQEASNRSGTVQASAPHAIKNFLRNKLAL